MATTLIQSSVQAGAGGLTAVGNPGGNLSAAPGNAALGTTVSTPPYIVNGAVAAFLRFVDVGGAVNTKIVCDLVMPMGMGNLAGAYLVSYVCNATPALT